MHELAVDNAHDRLSTLPILAMCKSSWLPLCCHPLFRSLVGACDGQGFAKALQRLNSSTKSSPVVEHLQRLLPRLHRQHAVVARLPGGGVRAIRRNHHKLVLHLRMHSADWQSLPRD